MLLVAFVVSFLGEFVCIDWLDALLDGGRAGFLHSEQRLVPAVGGRIMRCRLGPFFFPSRVSSCAPILLMPPWMVCGLAFRVPQHVRSVERYWSGLQGLCMVVVARLQECCAGVEVNVCGCGDAVASRFVLHDQESHPPLV